MQALPRLRCAPLGAQPAAPRRAARAQSRALPAAPRLARAPRRVAQPRRRVARPLAVLSEPPSAAELAAERALVADTGDIVGIPRSEWLRLQSPARYLGNEWGAVHKPWGDATVRFALAYPEVYEVGASNLGHIVLYTVLNETPGLLCDRAYLPAPDAQALLAKHAVPLFAVEARRPLRDFHAVGLSLAYELSCTNLLQTIHLAGLPLTWQERADADAAATAFEPASDDPGAPAWNVERGALPLVFVGGPTATSNPEPYADFADFFALGDGEDCLPEIGRCLQDAVARRLSRRGTLLLLARTVRGVYVPRFYDVLPSWGGAVFPTEEGVLPRVLRRVATPNPAQQIGLVPYVTTVHDRLTIEIRRGCTRGCRFCQPGMLTRPARDVDPEAVIAAVEDGIRKTGYTDFSLLSLSCSDYLALPSVGLELRNRLADKNISLNLPSQRVDRFDENIGNIMGGARSTPSITFAPEAGTQRLRDVINKGLTNAELRRGVVTAFDQGWRRVKLYFMIGLPGETDEDVLGIAETIRFLQRECSGRNRSGGRGGLAVTATISNFTPKPHTPFQWHSVSTAEFERKQTLLRKAMRRAGSRGRDDEVKLNFTSVRISAMEDFLGRGDRRLCAVVRSAWERGGANEAWWEGSDASFSAWDAAIAASGLTWKYRQVADGEWDVLESVGDERFRGQGGAGKGRVDRGALADARLDAPLPWDHVDTGISRAWLKTDLQRALEATTVPDCSHTVCSECGVCGDDFGQNVVAPVPPLPVYNGDYTPDTLRAQRLRVRFTKTGDICCVGHMDMMRLFERAARRADLPVSQDESPYHSRPRIMAGMALGLGATADAELIEFILTRRVPPAEAVALLAAQMPEGVTVALDGEYSLQGSLHDRVQTLGGAITGAEWLIQLGPGGSDAPADGESDDAEAVLNEPLSAADGGALWAGMQGAEPTAADYASLAAALLARPSFSFKKKTKGGSLAVLELRPALLELHLASDADAARLTRADEHGGRLPPGTAALRFRGAFGIDARGQGLLGPEHVVHMLSALAGVPLQLLHVHRTAIETDDAAQRLSEAQAAAAALTAVQLVEQRKAFALAAASRNDEPRTVAA